MSRYHRADIPGATYFFTVATYRRRPILCDAPVRTALRNAVKTVQSRYPFTIDAWVLLPDHLHCVWTLPPGDANYSLRRGLIKRMVSYECAPNYHRADWRPHLKPNTVNQPSGNGVTGNIALPRNWIIRITLITSLSIHLNMAWCRVYGIGLFRLFTAMSRGVFIPWIGRGRPTRFHWPVAVNPCDRSCWFCFGEHPRWAASFRNRTFHG